MYARNALCYSCSCPTKTENNKIDTSLVGTALQASSYQRSYSVHKNVGQDKRKKDTASETDKITNNGALSVSNLDAALYMVIPVVKAGHNIRTTSHK